MRSKRSVLILGSHSGYSRSKGRHLSESAASLGLLPVTALARHTTGVLITSDSRALDAALICKTYGLSGPSLEAAVVLSSKALAYNYLAACGCRVLPWTIPREWADLSCSLAAKVILKPERGSGQVGPHPWSYRVFDDLGDFADFLRKRRLVRRFFEYQRSPSAESGRYLAMEFVPGPKQFGITAVYSGQAYQVCNTWSSRRMPGSHVFSSRFLMGDEPADIPEALRVFDAVLELGWKRAMLSVQFVQKGTVLYPIDINLRASSVFDLAVGRLGQGFHLQALRCMFGDAVRIDSGLPQPYLGVVRVPVPLESTPRRALFPRTVTPLLTRIRFDPARPYDHSRAYPVFAFACRSEREFLRRSDQAIAETRICAEGVRAP
jgi:hypothetical protein